MIHNGSSEEEVKEKKKKTNNNKKKTKEKEESALIFVGSGSSSGTPRIICLTSQAQCEVCLDALKPGSKNRRRNPSILLQHGNKNILIDCGKSFRESIINCIVKHEISHLDAVLLTHTHADACFGLDDLREFTEKRSLRVYVRKKEFPFIERAFPYLVDTRTATGSGCVATIDWKPFSEDQPLHIGGLKITPLLVEHGEGNDCLGFRFGGVVYLSDLSGIPNETRKLLSEMGEIELLIIDALRLEVVVSSHYSLQQALDEIRRLKPKKSLLIGMTHEFHYDKMNAKLAKLKETEGMDVQLSFDGMKVLIDLE